MAGVTPAERLLELYNGKWGQQIDPVFEELLYWGEALQWGHFACKPCKFSGVIFVFFKAAFSLWLQIYLSTGIICVVNLRHEVSFLIWTEHSQLIVPVYYWTVENNRTSWDEFICITWRHVVGKKVNTSSFCCSPAYIFLISPSNWLFKLFPYSYSSVIPCSNSRNAPEREKASHRLLGIDFFYIIFIYIYFLS